MLMSPEELNLIAHSLAGQGGADVMEALEAAAGLIEAKLGRKLLRGDYTYSQLLPEGRAILLEAWPVSEVRSVTVDGCAAAHWLLDAERGIVLLDRPAHAMVQVEYTGGLDEAPAPIRQAVALTAMAVLRSAEHQGQTLMSERLGDYQEMYYNQSEHSSELTISPAAEALIAPYRRKRW